MTGPWNVFLPVGPSQGHDPGAGGFGMRGNLGDSQCHDLSSWSPAQYFTGGRLECPSSP